MKTLTFPDVVYIVYVNIIEIIQINELSQTKVYCSEYLGLLGTFCIIMPLHKLFQIQSSPVTTNSSGQDIFVRHTGV